MVGVDGIYLLTEKFHREIPANESRTKKEPLNMCTFLEFFEFF